MQNLNLALLQSELVWEDSKKNLAGFDKKLARLKGPTDLIILPEMFNTGFSTNAEKYAETTGGMAFRWLQKTAVERSCVVTGSILTKANGKYYNRLYWMEANGKFKTYDKRHLFRLGKEWQVMTAGEEHLIVNLKGWNIMPLICYDLRFPVWSMNEMIGETYKYDLLIYVANWPVNRKYAWKQLLIARGIENQAYVAGANRVGMDGNGVQHSGDTMLIDPKGQVLAQARPHHEENIQVELHYDELSNFRKQFNFGLDWDKFEIIK